MAQLNQDLTLRLTTDGEYLSHLLMLQGLEMIAEEGTQLWGGTSPEAELAQCILDKVAELEEDAI